MKNKKSRIMNQKLRIIKKLKNKNYKLKTSEEGSALILTIIVMVTGLFIVASVSVVSIIEGKMSQKTRHSTPALQKADSGLEIVLGQFNNGLGGGDPTIEEICESGGVVTDGIGKWESGDDYCGIDLDGDSTEYEAKIYFINNSGDIITDNSKKFTDIKAVRSVGIEKINDEDYVTRALQTDLNLGS